MKNSQKMSLNKARTIFFDKKAASIILMIFELLVVVLVVGMAFFAAKNFAKSETIQKELITEDLRMMVNALIAVPGEVIVKYPQDTSAFIFILSTSEVIGYLKGEEQQKHLGSSVHKPLFLPVDDRNEPFFTASGTVEGISSICLEKKNKHISLRPCSEIKSKENEEEGESP